MTVYNHKVVLIHGFFCYYCIKAEDTSKGVLTIIKIAICDDEHSELQKLEFFLREYQAKYILPFDIEYKLFCNGDELLSSIESGERFDLIVLDVLMPLINGIDTAKEIRLHNQMTKIVFLTSSSEFAVESYQVKAFNYLLKPTEKDIFFKLIQSVFDELFGFENKYLLINAKSGLAKVYLCNIVYVEIIERTLYFHLRNGGVLEEPGSMNDLAQKLLVFHEFVKPHRSYIVNMNYISNITATEIDTITGSQIPIPQKGFAATKKAFFDYSFKRT